MKQATFTLTGQSEYIQGKFHGEDKLSKELADAYEQRTWKLKAHYNGEEQVIVPALSVKNCLAGIAKHLSIQIPGKGKATYTKHFSRGILITDDAILTVNDKPVTKESVQPKNMFVPSDGVAGSGKRVMRIFPVIPPGWKATFTATITDDVITKDVFENHLKQAGFLIGLGSFRVQNGGIVGIFKHELLKWEDFAL